MAGEGDEQFIGAFSSPRPSHVRNCSIPVLLGGHWGKSHLGPHAALVRYFILVAFGPKKSFTYDEFRNRGGPGSILRPTPRPTSVRDCLPQPA